MSYFLNCDTLLSDKCGLGNYAIEWRQDAIDGPIVFVSGNQGNLDEDIEGYHPLVDEIVQGGTLYPVIRYAYLDGQKYTAEYEEGVLHSPDFSSCLSPVVVDVLTCGDTNYTGDYDYQLIREVYTGEKSRSIKFDITSSSNYLAWGFNAETIADGIKIYYCTLADRDGILLDFIISGTSGITTNYNPIDYPNNPIVINTGYARVVKYITDFSGITYTAGDFLKIEIIGNYYTPTQDDTKWTLYLKCFDILGEVYDTSNFHTIDSTPVMNWNNVNCYYTVTYDTIDQIPKIGGITSSFFYKYLYMNQEGSSTINSLNGGGCYLSWKENITWNGGIGSGCFTLNGSITYTKVSTGVQLSFTNSLDYDKAISDINLIINGSYYDDYLSATDKDIAYYGNYWINGYNPGTSCDNPGTSIYWQIHLSSEITYDPINKQTLFFAFPTTPITNNMDVPEGDCNDNGYNRAQSEVYSMNLIISLPDNTTYTIYLTRSRIIGSSIYVPMSDYVDNLYSYSYVYIPVIMVNNLFDPLLYGYCQKYGSGGLYYYSYQVKDYVEITDTSSHEARLANWKISRSKYFTTGDCADIETYELIYEATTTTTTTSP